MNYLVTYMPLLSYVAAGGRVGVRVRRDHGRTCPGASWELLLYVTKEIEDINKDCRLKSPNLTPVKLPRCVTRPLHSWAGWSAGTGGVVFGGSL